MADTATDDLVDRFAVALKEKLRAASRKYGFGTEWLETDWRESLVRQLHEHIAKGDPRDVAAYCAFAWHHGWSLSANPASPEGRVELQRISDIVSGVFKRGVRQSSPDSLANSFNAIGDIAREGLDRLSNQKTGE